MSRYLHQLARETHSKLRAPFGLRIAPRAPAFYEEIHEERLVSATAASGELSRAPSLSLESLAAEPRIPAARRPELPRVEEASAATVTETPHPLPSAPPVDRSVNAARPMRPPARAAVPPNEAMPASLPNARQTPARMVERAASPPPASRGDPVSAVPTQLWREEDQKILETVAGSALVPSTAFLVDEERTRAKEPHHPIASATRTPAEAPMAMRQASPQPVIDVTIGKVEVIIEGDVAPPLRAVRRADSRVAAPTRPAPPTAGRLARQYLDR